MAREVRCKGEVSRAPSPPAGGQGCCPSGARFAPLRVVIPQPLGWVGLCQRQGCASPVLAILAMLALRAVRGSGLLRAALDPAPILKTRLRASQSLVDTFKRPSATGHRIALGGPLRPPDGHSGPAWSSPAPQAWFRGSAPAPSPFGFDALADGSIEPLPERLALSMGGSDRRVSGLGRHPRGRTTEQAAALFWQFSASIKSFNENNVLSKSGQHRLTRKHTRFGLAVEAQWSVQVAGAKRPATLPDWRSPGAECQRRRSGAEQPEPRTACRASMARIASTHPLTRRWGQRPQLNKLTSGRQARPPKGGSGALPGQSFYVHKNISGYFASRGQIAHVAWQRISAPFVKTVEPLCFSRQSENAGSAQPGQPGRVAVVANRCCGIPSQTERGRR